MTDNDVLAQLDWKTSEIRCQCEQAHHTNGCRNPATQQVEFHALDHCNDTAETQQGELNPFGNYVFLLCDPCLHDLAHTVMQHVHRLNAFSRPVCMTCGAPVVELKDVFREITDL